VTRLHLVRHGAATGDEGDPGLSPAGVAQSRLLADRLRTAGAVEVRHSPRRRAVETAEVLGGVCEIPAVADPRLDDRTPVPAPGEETLYPAQLRDWFGAVPAAERDEGGVQLSAAVETFLADDRQLVLVTHAFVVAWFVQRVLGAPVSAWTSILASNAGLTTIDRRPGRPPQLVGVNDVGHLDQLDAR
jgi:probable phosphoglycerate mutase